MRRGSLRLRLTVITVGLAGLTLVGACAGLVHEQTRLLSENLDDVLDQRLDDVAHLAAAGELPRELGGGEDTAVQVTGPSGVVSASAELRDAPAVLVPLPSHERVHLTRDVPPLAGSQRIAAQEVVSPTGTVRVLVIGTRSDIVESRATLIKATATGAPLLLLLVGLGTWVLVGRALRHVEQIRAEVEEITAGELDRRVPERPGDDEVARLASTMNAMLARVQAATAREVGFVADASHELRTPLTRMRTELEVALGGDLAPSESMRLASLLDEVKGLERLVDGLLELARGGTPTAAEVDLDDLLLDALPSLRAALPDGEVRLEHVDAVRVLGDEVGLRRVIDNLGSNACRHARGLVRLRLDGQGEQAVLRIQDDGPGIPLADRERVFDRFTRLDGSRTATTGGVGLGLAIVREVAERHGGTVAVEDSDSGCLVELRLPRLPEPP